jgi:hypothetical protein
MPPEIGKRECRGNFNKMPWHLLPLDALCEVVRVYQSGAKKYAPRNWEKGLPYSETFGAMMRHYYAWAVCHESTDPESNCHHLAHVVWNALALLTFELRGLGQERGLDDRKRQPKCESEICGQENAKRRPKRQPGKSEVCDQEDAKWSPDDH